jgi:predicted MFS family arabinose efflux permease
MKPMAGKAKQRVFSPYQAFVIAILAILQFTIVLDFMVLSPLGAILLDKLHINTSQFGLVVSAYAFSAGGSGLLAAGFADKFDRKKMLLFFYTGFILGTVLCAIAPNYHFLLIARIITGLFGGVVGSVSFAIIADLFKMEVRGRVMGFVQMSFAASQVLGIPVGLYLATHLGWHSPFWMISGFGFIVGVVILIYLRPVTGHLGAKPANPFLHLAKTLSTPRYLLAFATTTLLATGGFMLMPFASAFTVHNLNITLDDLPFLYLVTGISAILFGPLIGKMSDKFGKYTVFFIGSLITIIMVVIYTNLGPVSLWLLMLINVLLFLGVTSRMISSSALIMGIPDLRDRGAFMSINSSVQQIAGGIGSAVAGLIVVQTASGKILHYNWLGYVVIAAVLIVLSLMYLVNRSIQQKKQVTKEAMPSNEILTGPAT